MRPHSRDFLDEFLSGRSLPIEMLQLSGAVHARHGSMFDSGSARKWLAENRQLGETFGTSSAQAQYTPPASEDCLSRESPLGELRAQSMPPTRGRGDYERPTWVKRSFGPCDLLLWKRPWTSLPEKSRERQA